MVHNRALNSGRRLFIAHTLATLPAESGWNKRTATGFSRAWRREWLAPGVPTHHCCIIGNSRVTTLFIQFITKEHINSAKWRQKTSAHLIRTKAAYTLPQCQIESSNAPCRHAIYNYRYRSSSFDSEDSRRCSYSGSRCLFSVFLRPQTANYIFLKIKKSKQYIKLGKKCTLLHTSVRPRNFRWFRNSWSGWRLLRQCPINTPI